MVAFGAILELDVGTWLDLGWVCVWVGYFLVPCGQLVWHSFITYKNVAFWNILHGFHNFVLFQQGCEKSIGNKIGTLSHAPTKADQLIDSHYEASVSLLGHLVLFIIPNQTCHPAAGTNHGDHPHWVLLWCVWRSHFRWSSYQLKLALVTPLLMELASSVAAGSAPSYLNGLVGAHAANLLSPTFHTNVTSGKAPCTDTASRTIFKPPSTKE